ISWPSNTTRPDDAGGTPRTMRPIVVLPQPDSPTSPSVSCSESPKLTPSTAGTERVRPCSAASMPARAWYCLRRSVTSSSGLATARLAGMEMAAHAVARRDRGQRRLLAHAACPNRVGDAIAACMEAAPARDIHRVDDLAADNRKPTIDRVAPAVGLRARQ